MVKGLEKHVEKLRDELERILGYNPKKGANDAGVIADRFFADLPFLHEKIDQDITAMYEGDPAARSRSEVIRTYPGFYAVSAYRIANALHTLGVHEIPRVITEHAHSKTGIDIHPAARIGQHF